MAIEDSITKQKKNNSVNINHKTQNLFKQRKSKLTKMWKRTLVVLLYIGCCQIEAIESLRILALFPLNSKSHQAMCDRLARELSSRGHHVDVYSHYPPKNPISNYHHYNLDGSLQSLTNNMSYKAAVQFQAQNPRDILAAVGTPSCKLMQLPVFRRLFDQPPSYDLVIIEVFVADCYLAWGRHLKVPMIGVMTTTMMDWYNEPTGNPFNKAVVPALGSHDFKPTNFFDRLNNFFTSNLVEFLFARAIREQDQFVEDLFGPGYPDVITLRRDLDLLLINSHYSLDGIRAYTPAVVPVAGMHIDEDNESQLPRDIQQWLDDSKDGCVYFSFGSMLTIESFPKTVLRAFYAAFRDIAPVRVLLKIANSNELPEKLPENVMSRPWFPQLRVLKHNNTKAFITHGGLMSSQESIHSAVPMIGIPIFGDQHNNVEVNVKKEIATSVQLATLDEQKLIAAIKDVLYNPSYKQNIEKIQRVFIDRPMKPLDTAIYWVEYVARHGKKCLRSPLVDMPCWQANLLDVYAFLLCIVLLIYYVVKFFIKQVYSRCCSSKKEINHSSRKLKNKKER